MDLLSSEEELILEKNLVWIFADRRSGTTWLALELLSHNTKIMDEPLIGLHLGKFSHTNENIKRTLDIQGDRDDYFFLKILQTNLETTFTKTNSEQSVLSIS